MTATVWTCWTWDMASSDVQKAADYTDLDSGKQTWEAVSLGWRLHRSRWDYPGKGYWTHIFKSRSRGIPVSLTTSARILIFSCPRHFCFSGIQTWTGIYNIVPLLSEPWRTPLVFLGQPAHRQLLMGLLSLHYHVNKYLMLNAKNLSTHLSILLVLSLWITLTNKVTILHEFGRKQKSRPRKNLERKLSSGQKRRKEIRGDGLTGTEVIKMSKAVENPGEVRTKVSIGFYPKGISQSLERRQSRWWPGGYLSHCSDWSVNS